MTKSILISTACGLSAITAMAQSNQELKAELDSSFSINKNEIGFFGQGSFGYPNLSGEAKAGLMYKRWVKPNVALRFSAGVNPLSKMYQPRIGTSTFNDSVRVFYQDQNVNRYFVSIGIETQRHFYKRIHLFAGVDLTGGYGQGKQYNYSRDVPVDMADRYYYSNWGDGHISSTYRSGYLGLSPYIGAKVVHKRLTYGIEASLGNLGVSYEKTGAEKAIYAPTFDQLNNYSIRFFLSYRLGKK